MSVVVTLRATRKVLRFLPQSVDEAGASDNALGDWYVNRVIVHRRPLLLLVSSASLLAIVTPARDVKSLPGRLAQTVGDRLHRLEISEAIVECEVEASADVRVGKTIDRSVTGQLVDFARLLPFYLPVGGWDEATLRAVEEKLADMPCRSSRSFDETIWPRRTAVELLNAAWPSSRTRH